MFDIIARLFSEDDRVRARRALASQRRWRFETNINLEHNELVRQDFVLLNNKAKPRATGVMMIPAGKGIISLFDLSYSHGFATKKTTVLEYRHPEMQLAKFMIRPKKSGRTVRNMYDRSFESLPTTPDFDQKYNVFGTDESMLRQSVSMDFFDEWENDPDWTIEGGGHHLVAYKENQLIPLEQTVAAIDRFIDRCKKLDRRAYRQ